MCGYETVDWIGSSGEYIRSILFAQKSEHILWLQILRKENIAYMPLCISYDEVQFLGCFQANLQFLVCVDTKL
mgnify:CR=1 FL=1